MHVTRRSFSRTVLLGAALCFAQFPVAPAINAQDAPAMVVLVRHAEKATVPGNDPPLSEAGQLRAKALAAALADANISAVIVTTFKRTNETGQPLADARSLKVQQIAIDGTTAAHVANVAEAVRKHPGGVVLVVGHSNTIPAIIAALGGPKMPDICDSSYSNLFVLQLGKEGRPATLVRSKYGAADPDAGDKCAAMTR